MTLKDWGDTLLELPSGRWHNEFTGGDFTDAVTPATLFKIFPVALLARKEDES
jgi:maltooligosyltrehalose synthase